ncbi:MAG: acetate kinase, partial [Acidobacteriota bacterium]
MHAEDGAEMNILTINCGSSSLKVRLCAFDGSGVTTIMDGAVEAIGPSAVVNIRPTGGAASSTSSAVADHAAALRTLMDLLGDYLRRSIEAVGHRVVQGGAFTQPALINDGVLRAIDAGRRLAPLHNGPSLEGINAARELLPNI